jgi:membrane protein DedA with SNARE-associated domain
MFAATGGSVLHRRQADRLEMSAVTHLLSHWGYVALVVLTVAEAACIPIPSEVTLGFAGYLVSTHRLELVPVILLATAGELAGAFIGYGVGRTGGRALIERLGRYVLLTKSDLDRAQEWFERRGEPAVLIGRMLPIVRTFISLPAGVGEMNPVRFGAFTALGSAAWCTALAITGYELGSKWNEITKGFADAGYVIAAVAVVAIAAFIAHRLVVLRRERAAQALRLASVGGRPGNPSEE